MAREGLRSGTPQPYGRAATPLFRPGPLDLHQHLWPEQLVEALRRDRAAYLRGWTGYVDGEPAYRPWASVSSREADVEGLRARLDAGFVGVQTPEVRVLRRRASPLEGASTN